MSEPEEEFDELEYPEKMYQKFKGCLGFGFFFGDRGQLLAIYYDFEFLLHG